MLRVLVIEFLHACPEAYAAASASMRAEGRQMLTAAIEDIGRIADVSVILCDSANTDLRLKSKATVLISTDCTDAASTIQQIQTFCQKGFDAVLPIAPECGGTLPKLISSLNNSNTTVLSAPLKSVHLCSDKWSTYHFLEKLALPTLFTSLIDDVHQLNIFHDEHLVVKPRDGAGCEAVRVVKWDELSTRCHSRAKGVSTNFQSVASDSTEAWWQQVLATSHEPTSGFIVQKFQSGDSYSIGIIASGVDQAPLILPLAKQEIDWHNCQPIYLGGRIPANIDQSVALMAREFAEQIAAALNVTLGYVGIDFLLTHDTRELLITEINPRLCSSYIGYRMATKNNLAEILLNKQPQQSVEWINTCTAFSLDHSAPTNSRSS